MVNRSNLIGQTDTGRLSALGSVTQRDYNYIKSILNDEEMLRYFAEPSLSDNNEKIDWYTQVEGRAKSFNDLNRQEANRTTEELNKLMLKLAEKAKATNNNCKPQFAMPRVRSKCWTNLERNRNIRKLITVRRLPCINHLLFQTNPRHEVDIFTPPPNIVCRRYGPHQVLFYRLL